MFLSKFLYNFGLQAYFYTAKLISPFNKKASQWIAGREIKVKKISEKSIWFHCASLGEFEQARPLLEKLKTAYPKYKIVLSFYSPSGYEVRKNYEQADFIYYLPLDTQKNAKDFIAKINPALVFFVKYEFWYHFLKELKQEKIPTFLVSGIFRKEQMFFKKQGVFFKELLTCFTHLFVQDDNSLELLKSIEINNVSIAKDSRFDRVYDIFQKAKQFPEIKQFVDDEKCIVLGSSWLVDEKMFAELLPKFQDVKFIVAPHNINKRRLKEVENVFSNSVFYSKINENAKNKQVLIIDNYGMLSSIYRYGDIAYIGGGFGVSIHNILEAVVYSIPAVFGPAHYKMKEASDLIKLGAGFEVKDKIELEVRLETLLKREKYLESVSKIAGNYVENNRGGTEKVFNFLEKENFLEK